MIHRYLYFALRNMSVMSVVRNAKYSRKIQHNVLLEKIRRHSDSDFGRVHGFSNIRSLKDFRKHIPVSQYEHYRGYIDRVMHGDVNALFNPKTQVLMFAMTSGTTEKPKFVPVTKEFFDEYKRGWNLWGVAVHWQHKKLLRQKILKLASNWDQQRSPANIPCGNISGLVSETAPLVARSRFTLPHATYEINDSEAKHYTALRLAAATRDVGMIGTANPSTLIHFARFADENRELIIRDIHDGSLSCSIPDKQRSKLSRFFNQRDPSRARELELVVENHAHLFPRYLWPELSLLTVWTGGSASVYLPKLEQFYGDVPRRDHGLNASEGRMTLPLSDNCNYGLLEYFSHFFEFIPVEEYDSTQPTVLEAHELEEGHDYYILLTTSAGLYRYDINDVVRCTGYEGTAPLLQFLNKGAHFSSVTGEKLSEYQVVKAVAGALTELGLSVEHFTLAPEMGDPPGYLLLIEQSLTAQQTDILATLVETNLQKMNWEYSEKRNSGRLNALRVSNLARGTWNALRREKTAARGNLEEYKHPCLSGDLGFVDRIRALQPGVSSAPRYDYIQ